ncbi:short chain dehydrogenase/ reductase [Aspergillus pseudoustus]|uniref:Short chain dehydrogenase/ reductase n=1 Tax=Aspergillus pseudoustus TaxID=1810923 RepID=A0ABR4L240_9EURO
MAQTPSMPGVALITGAASGIGRATAHTFLKEGCKRFALGDLNEEGLQSTSAELKNMNPAVQVFTAVVDISSEGQINNFIRGAADAFGGIHYAVNNAGITSNPRVRSHELPVEAWEKVVNVNLRGTWLCQRAILGQMMKQERELETRTGSGPQRGAIVNISSIFGIRSFTSVGAYSATKSGILGMTRTDAIDYAAEGIRINSVLPGYIKTPMVAESIRRGADYEPIIDTIPGKRWGTPEELAEAVVFLASEKASWINGTELVVDGGKVICG